MRRRSNGAARVAMLYGRISTDSARMARGPKRAPGRLEVPMSRGTPTTATSSWSSGVFAGKRMKVAMPPKRGIWLPPSGWG